MRTAVIRLSELGSCWLPARILSTCLGCQRYATCTYPERQWHIGYERNRRERAALVAQVDLLDEAARNLLKGES